MADTSSHQGQLEAHLLPELSPSTPAPLSSTLPINNTGDCTTRRNTNATVAVSPPLTSRRNNAPLSLMTGTCPQSHAGELRCETLPMRGNGIGRTDKMDARETRDVLSSAMRVLDLHGSSRLKKCQTVTGYTLTGNVT